MKKLIIFIFLFLCLLGYSQIKDTLAVGQIAIIQRPTTTVFDTISRATYISSKTGIIKATSGHIYYVSTSDGNNSNNGTSTSTPWKTCAKVNSVTLVAGDVVLFKAGDIFELPLNIGNSGTSTNRITISKYGTGVKPIFYGDHPSAVWSAVSGHSGVYSTTLTGSAATIQNVFEVGGTKYNLRNQGADDLNTWLGKFTASEWGYNGSTVYIRTTNDGTPPQMHVVEWTGIKANNSGNYVTFDNLDVRNSHLAIMSSYVNCCIIKNNNCQDNFNSGVFYLYSNKGEAMYNTITRVGETGLYLLKGGDHYIHNNTISYSIRTILGCEVPIVSRPECCGIGLQQGIGNLVEYNDISYTYGSIIDYWVEVNSIVRYNKGFNSRGGAYPDGTGLQLYYNVFDLDGQGGGIAGSHEYDPVNSPTTDTGSNYIYNNTIVNPISYALLFTPGGTGVVYKNNLVVTSSNLVALSEVGSSLTIDYTGYFNTTGSPKGWYWNTTKYTTLSAYQTASSQESHSFYGDPLFTSASTKNFTLQSGSPAINAGVNVGLTRDILGNPIVGNPDIGAYEKQ